MGSICIESEPYLWKLYNINSKRNIKGQSKSKLDYLIFDKLRKLFKKLCWLETLHTINVKDMLL